MLNEPLDPEPAKQLIRTILQSGDVAFSRHALDELAKDSLTRVDVVNVLRGGVVGPGELEHGSWRHQVRAGRIVVVIAFRSETALVVVTAWRVGK